MKDQARKKVEVLLALSRTKQIPLKESFMSRKSACSVVLVLICWASLVVPASAQHFQQVKGTLASVSAGRNEVFGLDGQNAVWRFNAKTSAFAKIKKVSLFDIAVGGGTLAQLDEVWGLDASGGIHRFNYTTNTFDPVDGTLTQIAVGAGNQDDCHPYEVWGVNSGDSIFRYNYCTNLFVAITGSLTQVATGGGDVWGINGSGAIFHFSFGKQLFEAVPGGMIQVAVGVNDVWAIQENDPAVFRYDPATGNFNGVQPNISQVAAGGDGVWLIDKSDGIWRFDSSSEAFVEVGGTLKNIAVGSGAGVFGVNAAGEVFTFVRP